jgi:hypothetical protein
VVRLNQPFLEENRDLTSSEFQQIEKFSKLIRDEIMGLETIIAELVDKLNPSHYLVVEATGFFLIGLHYWCCLNRKEKILSRTIWFDPTSCVISDWIQFWESSSPPFWLETCRLIVEKGKWLHEVLIKFESELSVAPGD